MRSMEQLIAAPRSAVAKHGAPNRFDASALFLWHGGPEPAHAGRIGKQKLGDLQAAIDSAGCNFVVVDYATEPQRGFSVAPRR